MKDDRDKREGQAGGPAKKDPGKNQRKNPRQDRLKLALRENLKRRKSQARGRSDSAIASSHDVDVSRHEENGKKPGE
jgi:hypothetical protein